MIDSVEISTTTSSRKCTQMIATTTNYGRVLQFSVILRIAAVHVSMQSRQMRKRTFLLVCHSNKCADGKEKREYYCYSMSAYGYFIIRYLQCRQSYKYIRFGRPYCYFRLLVVIRIMWGYFLWTRHGRKPKICRLNFDAIYISSWDISTSGLGGHIATVAADVSTMTR